ncbi:hypothetical protein B0A48_04841 [Cryoendolithus antarcticus]|uniref:Uncharacterized protein n=1 Tax=Cryoendolithus antarcticus TaxID=1507870 RepID=A0A1V8TE01_9PEZI|nr:hypothetical protein B0A48_04841 [Cryoendolithus antarcticus]
MFGLITTGRPVNATPTQVSDTSYAFRIPPTPAFSHIVVFLLPGTNLPEGTAASVYAQIPPSTEFKFLGGVGPGKESAIFRIGALKGGSDAEGDADLMTDSTPGTPVKGATSGGSEIVVGISIEPAAQVEAQMLTLQQSRTSTTGTSTPSTALVKAVTGTGSHVTTKVLAQRIIGNAFNFLASFGSDVVPLKAFQEWWTKFEKRVELDPGFLEREVGD